MEDHQGDGFQWVVWTAAVSPGDLAALAPANYAKTGVQQARALPMLSLAYGHVQLHSTMARVLLLVLMLLLLGVLLLRGWAMPTGTGAVGDPQPTVADSKHYGTAAASERFCQHSGEVTPEPRLAPARDTTPERTLPQCRVRTLLQ